MELTGKCKEDFDKWYVPSHYVYRTQEFWGLPDCMKFGAIQDFADSVGFEIDITPQYNYFEWQISWTDNDFKHGRTKNKSRPEARTESVNQFNIEYNK